MQKLKDLLWGTLTGTWIWKSELLWPFWEMIQQHLLKLDIKIKSYLISYNLPPRNKSTSS